MPSAEIPVWMVSFGAAYTVFPATAVHANTHTSMAAVISTVFIRFILKFLSMPLIKTTAM